MSTVKASPPRSRSLAAMIGTLAVVVGYVLGVFLPAQKHVRDQRREIREKTQFIQRSANSDGEIVALRQQAEQAREIVETWRKNSPAANNQVEVLASFATLAKDSGVLLERLVPQEPTALRSLQLQTVALEVVGPFSQIMKFLAGLEARPESTWVTKFQLEPGTEAGEDVRCALTVVVFADNREKSG